MKKSTNRLNLIICGIAFVVMVLYMIFVDGVDNIIGSLSQIKLLYLVAAVGLMLVYWLLESSALHVVMKSIYPKQKFKNTVVVSIIGQYFNCITPFASGGQPIQAYYLVKYGAPLGSSMTALLAKFIVYQFVLTAYSAVVLILRFTYFIEELSPLMALTVVGFVINSFVIAGLLILAFFKKAAFKIAHFVVKFLAKIHIIKDKEKKLAFIDEELEQYYENFMFIKRQPMVVLKMSLMTIVQLTAYFAISFVIYLGFGLSETDFLTIISCQAFVLMISSFVPLPGALGAAEGSYAAFFGNIFGSFVAVSTFIWRFLTFYFPIIVGLCVTLSLDRGKKAENADGEKTENEIKV